MPRPPAITLPDLRGRRAIVTGANAGIGRETARGLAAAGAEVVLACRSEARAAPVVAALHADGLTHTRFEALDLASFDSVRAFCDRMQEAAPIDLLICNAGVVGAAGQTVDGFELQFGVNHLGHFLLTELLLDRLMATPAPRVVLVSSEAAGWPRRIDWDRVAAPTPTNRARAYGVSKLANLLYARALARRTADTHLRVAAVHPGKVASDMFRGVAAWVKPLAQLVLLTPEQGARTSLWASVSPEVAAHSGGFWEACAPRRPPRLAQDEALQDELVRRSRAWVGLTTP